MPRYISPLQFLKAQSSLHNTSSPAYSHCIHPRFLWLFNYFVVSRFTCLYCLDALVPKASLFSPQAYHHPSPPHLVDTYTGSKCQHNRIIMCYQLVERYSACRCLHYQHAVDRCVAYGRPGHSVQQREILVGYACSMHTSSSGSYATHYSYSDSGYQSSRSSTTGSRGYR